MAAGTNNALNALGGVFGVAIMAAVFAGNGGYSGGSGFIGGFRPAEWVAAAVAAAGVAGAALAPSKRQLRRPSPVRSATSRLRSSSRQRTAAITRGHPSRVMAAPQLTGTLTQTGTAW